MNVNGRVSENRDHKGLNKMQFYPGFEIPEAQGGVSFRQRYDGKLCRVRSYLPSFLEGSDPGDLFYRASIKHLTRAP